MARPLDLSHEIEHEMVTYPGLLAPTISDWLSREAFRSRYTAGPTFQIGKVELLTNTGTYIDAPFHRYGGARRSGPQGARAAMARPLDLSHEIEHEMITYPGLLAPTISDWLSREAPRSRYTAGATFQIGTIELLVTTGTYSDAPFHRYGGTAGGQVLKALARLWPV